MRAPCATRWPSEVLRQNSSSTWLGSRSPVIPANRYTSDSLTVLLNRVLSPIAMSSTVLPPISAFELRRPDRALERLEQVLSEEVELTKVGCHRVQEQVLDTDVDPLLNPSLDLVDGAGEVDSLDVIPRPFV